MFAVEIICFGNELLIGKTVNTNANWLGKRVTTLGGTVTRITSVGDTSSEMIQIVKEALSREPAVLITTGGLGTTFDDISLEAIAKAVNRKLVFNEDALALIKERLENLKETRNITLELTDARKRMAMLPEGSIPLKNRSGSAPGILLEYNNTKIFSVPGVPAEMKAIFDYEIVKHLPQDPNQQYFDRSLIINKVPESELAYHISPIREKYPSVYFKTHPQSSSTSKGGMIEVEIHLTMFSSENDSKILDEIVKELVIVIEQLDGARGEKPIITMGENN